MRSPSTLPPTKLAALPAGGTFLADLSLIVVTSMFGGGVEPGHCDPGNLVRSSAIRGQLRFWWRACNAAGFTTLAALHQAERALWGAAAKDDDPTHGPGAIGVRIKIADAGIPYTQQTVTGQPRPVWRREGDTKERQGGPGYALFPFTRQTNPPREPLAGRVDVQFQLQLTLAPHAGRPGHPDHTRCKEAAEQALWAWITFGGVGSRTRRGCGTLLCLGTAATVANDERDDDASQPIDANELRPTGDIHAWLRTKFARHVATPIAGHITSVPSLSNCRILIGTLPREPIPAWNDAIEPLHTFLQGRGHGRNYGGQRPGQSFWPEVGAVRGILGFDDRTDDENNAYTVLSTAAATGEQFPRADLGLPRLIKLASAGAAPVATVEAGRKGFTRMASPIILKALPTSTSAAVPVALLLTAPHVWDTDAPGIRIKENLDHKLTPRALNDPDHPPRWPRPRTPPRNVTGAESARDAFMDYVASLKKGWNEWTPGEGDDDA